MEATGLQSCGRRMKAHAPPPPNHPPTPCKVNNEHSSATELGTFPDQSMINMKENLISRVVDFTVVFPDGEEQKDTVPGSKAVMDVLVDLCSRHHLNPADHILELRSLGTQHPLNYKPNTMIGILDVDKIVLKEKVPEEKTKRLPPKIPEKTVRLVVNYLKTQKAVVRVSPEVPLHCIIPAICEKCEVNQEYLVLLRDTFTGVELELSKSLNELGIKELYAWDRKKVPPSRAQSEPSLNYRETRNLSRTCEATEKERKRFLGYFKTNKRNNKAEESLTTTVDGDYGSKEPLKVTAASEQHLNEVTTFPHSSVNSRSVSLGPSLSLGNISGVTGSTEIKKRRAPPPPAILSQLPRVETNADENIGDKNILSQISQSSSQNDLQKKKRHAPPPPIPTMPNRMEETGDKRASTVGNLQVSRDIYSLDNKALELSKIEETISVNSCFVSEDTTEDSGVMSSPSDILSLNSQNDSMSSRSKSVGSQEALAEMGPMLVAEACSTSDESGNIYQRNMDGIKIMEPKVEDSDTFIADQLQDTLAALDKDLAAMEDIHENLENGSLSCAPTPLPQIAEAAPDISLPVPVTIIDEVQEVDFKIQSSKEEENYLFSMREAKEEIPVQPIFLCKQTSENNNTGSFTEEYVDDVSPCLYENLLPQQSLKEEVRHQTEEDQKYESDTYVPSLKKKNRKDACQEVTSPNEMDSEKLKAKVIAISHQFVQKVYEQRSKEEVRHLNKENTPEGLPSNLKIELQLRHASEKNLNKEKYSSLPSLRCHRVHNGITNYEPKIGLTTFKVVPPKPEVKYFDRDASLFTGAIKIDELGNLVTSHAPGNRKVIGSETEDTLIRRNKANWKSNSMGEQMEESPVGHSTKPVIITHFKPFNKISSINLDCPTSMKMTTSPLVDSSIVKNNTGLEKTEPPVPVTQPSLKTAGCPVISTDKTELLFQKPQRRTSSHYLASIIAKRIDPPQFETNQERNGREEETSNEKERKAEIDPVSQKCIIVTRYGPAETQSPKSEETGSNIFNCRQSMSNMVPLGAHSGITNNTTNIKSPDQTKFSKCCGVPFTTLLPKNNSITEKESISDSMKNVIIREMPPILNQKKEQIDQASFLRSPDVPSSSITFTPFLKSAMDHPYNSGLSSLGSLTVNQMFSKKNEKHASACAMSETESTVSNVSMYNIFGPKKKFKPVTQKPLPKDTSLHSALMEAIQTAGGREKLRKSTHSTGSEAQKKPLFMEPENERSALLAAIRSHSGVSGLRKISSSAAGELRRFQNAETVLQNKTVSTTEQQGNQLPLPLPQLSPQLTRKIPRSFKNKITKNTEDTRQALMEAIRSSTGAARLRKVPLLV